MHFKISYTKKIFFGLINSKTLKERVHKKLSKILLIELALTILKYFLS